MHAQLSASGADYQLLAPTTNSYKATQESARKALLCPGPAQARPWLPNKSETRFDTSARAHRGRDSACMPHANSYYSLTP